MSFFRKPLKLALLIVLGCSDNTPPPLSVADEAEPTLPISAPTEANSNQFGTVSISLNFPETLQVAPSRIEVVVTGTDTVDLYSERQLYSGRQFEGLRISAGRNRLFVLKAYDDAGELAYTGVAQADIAANEQIHLDIDFWPLDRRLSLMSAGIGEGASERFALKAQIPYIFRIRYIRQITVELIDALTGARIAVILDESGLSQFDVRTFRIVQLDASASFFLLVRNTEKVWRIDIEGY
ncbi:MAG: hypothetical protein GKR89_21465 [Candidatus Latescibacteria bacterium]|nr:hypothetical protein [Candidatus Latescibacterota bacterium]